MQFQQSLAQTLNLKMNPQLYQSIKLMELPSLELREKIEEELERNPALEIIEDKTTVSLERSLQHKKKSKKNSSVDFRQFIEGTLSRAETLQEHLLWQLKLEPDIDDELRNTCEVLIQNLDNDGFCIVDPQTLFKNKPSDQLLEKAINIVRSLDPAGCCTKDYRESLKVQLELSGWPENQKEIDLLVDNLELIEKEKYTELAKKTGLDEEEMQEICEFIRMLSPFPGRAFSSADTRFVIPDVKVTRETGDDGQDELVINLNDEAFPVLGINKFYSKLSSLKKKNSASGSNELSAAKNFARENIREAHLFIDHLERRNKTLIRVVNAILQFQNSFFIKGPKYLAPLTLKDIAKELNVHETTVSRIANGKYMQTEWGIFEIKHFFSTSIKGSGGNEANFSRESVKEIIKEIISAENSKITQGGSKLSDQEISALLSQKGIAIARRTVAKYRKELDMGSSYTRARTESSYTRARTEGSNKRKGGL